jgi:Magnesium chelatase, subunit ChlI
MACRLTTVLPAMTLPEALETTRLHRGAGLIDHRTALVTTRPLRAPHHTSSDVGLIGGGQVPRPGGGVAGRRWPALREHAAGLSSPRATACAHPRITTRASWSSSPCAPGAGVLPRMMRAQERNSMYGS